MGNINIIAKNFSENASGSIREDAAQIRNHSEKQIVQNGEKGVNYDKNKDRKPPTDIRITKVEGPFDANGKLVENVVIGTSYTFKAIPTRKPNKTELGLLKWSVKLDDGKKQIILGTASVNKLEGEKIVISLILKQDFEKAKIYAFYQKASEKASVEINFAHLRLQITDEVIGYSIIRLFDVPNKGIGTTNPACIVKVYKAKLKLMQKNNPKELLTFGVTRDGWQKIDDVDKDTYYLINRAFEPADSKDNLYRALDYKYPNQIKGWIGFPAFKLTKNGSVKLPAVPLERNTKLDGKTPIAEPRKDINFARDVMVHIGGHYKRGGNVIIPGMNGIPRIVKIGPDWLGGSLGCFGFVESVDIKASFELARKASDDDDYDDTLSDDEWASTVSSIKKNREQYKLDLLIEVVKRNDVEMSTNFKKQDILWE